MNKKTGIVLLPIMLLVAATLLPLPGCARVVHKEYELVDGKSLLRSNTEYDRVGDQTLSGLEAMKNTPDGTQLSVKVEQQKSEGKLQIEGVISALTELATALMDKGMTAEAGQAQSAATTLETVNK